MSKKQARPDVRQPPPKPPILKRPAKDEDSVRQKSSGHKKKTADKWNQ